MRFQFISRHRRLNAKSNLSRRNWRVTFKGCSSIKRDAENILCKYFLVYDLNISRRKKMKTVGLPTNYGPAKEINSNFHLQVFAESNPKGFKYLHLRPTTNSTSFVEHPPTRRLKNAEVGGVNLRRARHKNLITRQAQPVARNKFKACRTWVMIMRSQLKLSVSKLFFASRNLKDVLYFSPVLGYQITFSELPTQFCGFQLDLSEGAVNNRTNYVEMFWIF